jgi:hypothetical protein
MTLHTRKRSLRKYQAFVALPAVECLVLAGEWHFGCIMIERTDGFIEFPAVQTMTKITAQLKIFAVRRIGHKSQRHQDGCRRNQHN